jgi:hypothetical protein
LGSAERRVVKGKDHRLRILKQDVTACENIAERKEGRGAPARKWELLLPSFLTHQNGRFSFLLNLPFKLCLVVSWGKGYS